MNKQELSIVALLFVLLIGWTFYQAKYGKPAAPPPGTEQGTNTVATAGGDATIGTVSNVQERVTNTPPETATAPVPPETVVVKRPEEPEKLVTLSNDSLTLTVSSWGAVVTSAELADYRETIDPDSRPVKLDFARRPALAVGGIAGLSTNCVFDIETVGAGRTARITRTTPEGIRFERTLSFDDTYRLIVTDRYANTGQTPIALAEHSVAVGPMAKVKSKSTNRRMPYLGLDTLIEGENSHVEPWGKKFLPKQFGAGGKFGCFGRKPAGTLPVSVSPRITNSVAWAAAKNKFFVQIVAPVGGADECRLYASRDVTSSNAFVMADVAADLIFEGRELEAGETLERTLSYYVGPKKFSELSKLGDKQDHIMLRAWKGWGWWRGACIGLLWLLNVLKTVTRNYGIAIILLTILVKIVMWPLTHKSTTNMKKMQAVQPLLQKAREKHKNDPQKMQQATMEVYREHKVNPMAGCLPMFLQMPVFIALFTVLRSAVELRFAPFLWIRDLSEPEGLLAGHIPIAGELNLLPLAMTATMVWQQKMTPSSGDPQQKQMMVFMPVMMLFLFYKMPSALVLYWTISQVLSILQLYMQKRKDGDGGGLIATPEFLRRKRSRHPVKS